MENTVDFLRLYEEMFKTLPSGDIQELLDICWDIIGVPILAVDIMYNVLGISPQTKTGDYQWDYLLENRGYETDMIVQLYEEGIMQSVNENEAPYIVDWGSCKDAPKIQGIIRVNDIIEGYVTMNCKDAPITSDKMKAMEIIQSTCAFFFKDRESESSMHYTYLKTLTGELFHHRIHSKKQLELWYKDTGIRLEPPYQVVAVSTDVTNEKNVLSYIRKSIRQFFPCQLALIQHNVLLILRYNMNITKNTQASEKQFHTILEKFSAHCGVSNTFDNLLELASFQMQAEDAMRLGSRLNRRYRIAYYEDYYLPAILLPRMEQMPQSNYLSPVIAKVQAYDKAHSTDFLPTLQVYINSLCSTAETAESLHIHRNTLLYRLNKIEELTGVSLGDPHTYMHLMISFYMSELEGR